MDRRDFHRVTTRLCASLLAAAPGITLADAVPMPRTRLVLPAGERFTEDRLAIGEAWIFNYPYRTTPCFLVRLPEPDIDGEHIVAFSAICSHKLTHPSRPISHIAYRDRPVRFTDANGEQHERAHLISCCSERSVYDPAAGARVLAGPARAPLARIALELEAGELLATGSTGADRYEDFLDAFGFRLALEHGTSDVRRRAGADTVVERAAQFSAQTIRC